jgi:triacylglycerol lipase
VAVARSAGVFSGRPRRPGPDGTAGSAVFAHSPGDLRIPIWGESRLALEHARLMASGLLRGRGVPRGHGEPVLLLPGFLAGDGTLQVIARWLRSIGYAPYRPGICANVDCTSRTVDRLHNHLERLSSHHGMRVTIVGHSRGGTMARILAVRRPDLVEGIVCLGSPLRNQLAVHPLVRMQLVAIGWLGAAGVPGLLSHDCFFGSCCATAHEQVTAPFPRRVRFVTIYSRSDGIIDWHACLDPAAQQVEVRSSHVGMTVNPAVFRVVAEALAGPR